MLLEREVSNNISNKEEEIKRRKKKTESIIVLSMQWEGISNNQEIEEKERNYLREKTIKNLNDGVNNSFIKAMSGGNHNMKGSMIKIKAS